MLVSLTWSVGLTLLQAGCHRQQIVVVLVGVQSSMDSPINSQIDPFSTILHDLYSMLYYKGLEVGMLGDSNIL